MDAPGDLLAGGRALWDAVTAEHDLDPAQHVQLVEACRAKDRCDELAVSLTGDPLAWPPGLLAQANTTANLMKQLLAALRLPDDVSGKRPQVRSARGGYAPKVPGGRVSSLDRARAAKAGA